MFGMLMALLGGCWYPIELFPEFVRTVVKVIPTTWAMQGLLDIVLRGQGLPAVLPEAAVLLGFAAIFYLSACCASGTNNPGRQEQPGKL
jgi:ABC-2 type transport system permease protein